MVIGEDVISDNKGKEIQVKYVMSLITDWFICTYIDSYVTVILLSIPP